MSEAGLGDAGTRDLLGGGGWVGGWREIEEDKAVGMRCCKKGGGRGGYKEGVSYPSECISYTQNKWVGGWVDGWVRTRRSVLKNQRAKKEVNPMAMAALLESVPMWERRYCLEEVGGWVGGL